jgi:hypothetical protein
MNRGRLGGRRVARLVRAIGRLAAVLLAVRLGIAIAGEIPTAAVLALVSIVAAVRWWARVVEPRLFAPRHIPRPPAVCVPPPDRASDARHIAFARALAIVAERYLAECEAERQP